MNNCLPAVSGSKALPASSDCPDLQHLRHFTGSMTGNAPGAFERHSLSLLGICRGSPAQL